MKKIIYTSITTIIATGIYFTNVYNDDSHPLDVNASVSENNFAVHAQHPTSHPIIQNQHHSSPHEPSHPIGASRIVGANQFHHSLPAQLNTPEEQEVIQLNTDDAQEVIQYPPPADEKNLAELDAQRQTRTKVELEQQLSLLKKSGVGGDVFLNKLQPAHNALLDLARQEIFPVNVSLLECFTSGCTTTLTYQKTESIDNLQMKMMSSPAFSKWDGIIYISGPLEAQSGVMESTIIFLDPNNPHKG